MKSAIFRTSALAAAMALIVPSAIAQQPSGATSLAVNTVSTESRAFSQQDLDQLLAPIALYPDSLLAQILMAATYPLEIVQADRWAKANPGVNGKKLEQAMLKQSWDPAVKALTAVPSVLKQMSENLEWTQKLGDAFLGQQKQIMATVQQLRARAYVAGNLKTTSQQIVTTEISGSQTIYIIQSAKPEIVYVPVYSPSVVYGAWWYGVPPYYLYPPTYVYPPGLTFTAGVIVGAAIWGHCHWGHSHGHVSVNISHYNTFNHTKITSTQWNHNVVHRRGVAYADQNVARQFGRGGPANRPSSFDKGLDRPNTGQGTSGRGGHDERFNPPASNDMRRAPGRIDSFDNGPRDHPGRNGPGPMGGPRERN